MSYQTSVLTVLVTYLTHIPHQSVNQSIHSIIVLTRCNHWINALWHRDILMRDVYSFTAIGTKFKSYLPRSMLQDFTPQAKLRLLHVIQLHILADPCSRFHMLPLLGSPPSPIPLPWSSLPHLPILWSTECCPCGPAMAAIAETKVFDKVRGFEQCLATQTKMDQDALSWENKRTKIPCAMCARKNNEESLAWL